MWIYPLDFVREKWQACRYQYATCPNMWIFFSQPMVTRREVHEIVESGASEQADLFKESFNQLTDRMDGFELGLSDLRTEMRQGFASLNKTMNRVLDLLGDQMGETKSLKGRMDRFEQVYPLSAT